MTQTERDPARRVQPASEEPAAGNVEPPLAPAGKGGEKAGPAPDPGGLAAALVAALPQPAILCGELGRVVAANAHCGDLLAASPLFIDRSGRLRAGMDTLDAELARLFRARDGAARILRVPDYGPTGDIILTLTWIGAAPAGSESARAAALALVCLAHEFRPEAAVAEALKRLYGLSDVEAALALAIYGGQRLADFAVRCKIDVLTAHRVRESVMERLAAHRSADVARRVAVVAHAAPAVAGLAR